MSNQRTFYDILDQFNSDEEEENEEDDISKRSEEIKQHKKIFNKHNKKKPQLHNQTHKYQRMILTDKRYLLELHQNLNILIEQFQTKCCKHIMVLIKMAIE